MYDERKISAKVERILHPREVNEFEVKNVPTFYILKVELNGRNEVAKGKMSNMPRQGERFSFEGKWEVSRYSGGMEFMFFHYSIDLPTDERSLLRLACEMTKGIGVALENKIWEALGENWRNIKYSDNIRGLTPTILTRLQETIEELNNQRERTSTVAWLMSVGCTVKMAEAAYDKWGAKTAVRVKEDPYLLAELPNYGFKDVDEHVRDKFGISKNDVRRVRAAIIYYVKQLTISDTVCAWPILFDKIHKAIDAEPAFISQICSDLFKDGVLIPFRSTGMIAWHIDNANESAILAYATEAGTPSGLKASQPKQAGFTFDESQLAAIQFALDSRFCVINGGAGCGKTTIIKSIADTLREHCMGVELCAFAGKAAARLKEATEHEACTIHRMLEYKGDFGFTRNSLRGSTVILDEASMVASDLLAEIIKRKPDRLILVGDEAQLPPVGSGQPFHDIVRLFPDRVRTLTTCYRNKEAIFHAALQIRGGMAPELHAQSERELWDVESIGNLRSTHARVLALVREGGVDFDKDIILCCRNGDTEGETECSVISLNADIKAIVNPSADDGETKFAQRFDPGDRVINTKNHADLDVWNGTTGKCDRFDASGAMWVKLDYPNAQHEDFVLIPKKQVREWQLAYALTVHKSQGSQYRKVFFVCTRRDTAALLDRPMLYTAVTRAKAECHVIGDTGAFYKAIVSTENKQTVIQQLVAQRSV